MYQPHRRTARLALVALSLSTAAAGRASVVAQVAGSDRPISPAVQSVFTVGVLEGAPWEMFGHIAAVAFDDEGTLFILDELAGHVVVIDSAGEFVRTISRPGDGPGELGQPIALAVFADGRVGVNDLAKPGLQLFNRDGEFLDTVPFSIAEGMPGSSIYALPDHSLVATELIGGSVSTMIGADEGRPITRFRLDGIREVVHAAWDDPPPAALESGASAEKARIVTSPVEAFGPPLSLGVLGDGRIALVDSVGYRIKLLDASGRVTNIVERPVTPIPVTGAIRESERRRRIEALRAGGGAVSVRQVGGRPGDVTPEARRNAMREALRRAEDRIQEMVFPAEIPVIANIAVDRGDRIWIHRTALPGETGPTDILTADGRYLGTIPAGGVRIPDAFGPEGLMAYIESDAFDVHRVRVVRLADDEFLEGGRQVSTPRPPLSTISLVDHAAACRNSRPSHRAASGEEPMRPPGSSCRLPVMAPLLRGGLALGFIGAAGCGPDSGGSPRSAGLDSSDFSIEPSVETVFVVGVLDGAPWETFGSIASLAFDADGTLFILDEAAGHVVAIDPSGGHLRTISRQGEGPGELARPAGLALFPDGRLGVMDFAKSGLQVFSRDGEFLDALRFAAGEGVPGTPFHVLPDHSLVTSEVFRRTVSDGSGEGRPIMRFRADGSGELLHSAWPGPPLDDTRVEDGQSGGVYFQLRPIRAFPPPLEVGVLRDGRIVVADSVGYRIKLLARDGATGEDVTTLERPVAPVAVTPRIRDAETERRLALLDLEGDALQEVLTEGVIRVAIQAPTGGSGGPDPGAIEAALRETYRRQIAYMVFPGEIPVISRIGVDWSDRLWVERTGLPGERGPTDILTAEGLYLGTIAPDGPRIPAAFGPNGLLAYIETDELGVQRVRVDRLAADELAEGIP